MKRFVQHFTPYIILCAADALVLHLSITQYLIVLSIILYACVVQHVAEALFK